MSLVVAPAPSSDDERIVAVLRDAEEDERHLRADLRDPDNQLYVATLGGLVVGAALVRWQQRPDSEILYLGLAEEHRRRGHGRRIIERLLDELPEHGRRLVVGTASSSIDNIAFYQRCGFRMYAVRRDHFAYLGREVLEFGIPVRDMIVFSHDLPDGVGPSPDSGLRG